MKLVTIASPARPGVLVGTNVLDLVAAPQFGVGRFPYASWSEALAAGSSAVAVAKAAAEKVDTLEQHARARFIEDGLLRPESESRLLAPIPEPKLIVCAASNYRSHSAEMNSPPPQEPACFIKAGTAVTANGEPIVLPPEAPDMVDYEGELCFVFGKAAYRVPEADAMDYVAGYLCGNDVSARDWVPALQAFGKDPAAHRYEPFLDPGTLNIRYKSFPTFMPFSHYIATADEVPDPHNLHIRTLVNGTALQDSNTNDLTFNVPQLIAHYSKFFRFEPGDIVCTGSPPGVGVARKPPIFLRPGDVVTVEIENVGVLTNPVVGYEAS